ncbi:MAG: shikimate kinase, partial [Endozoicomonas sp. (ex Botrylloides leachii)]|nr:shikimate kinase [Endozoicomonas sp. (ex Botrylloides leachii)]
RSSGFIVYLHTPVSVQLTRIAKDKQRPLIQQVDREKVLTSLLAEREPLYRELADLILDTDKLSPRKMINQIILTINANGVCNA